MNSGGTVTTYEAGQKVTFQFRVNQHGPSPFKFALLNSDNTPVTLTAGQGTLPSGIPNTVTAGADGFQGVNVPVTIPNYPCTNCAIQLSGMGQTSGSGTWFQCASISIVASGTLNQPQPSDVFPETAPTTGGITVTLKGIGFGATSQPMYCMVGTRVVTGTWVNSSAITCPIPPSNNAAPVSIEASNDGKKFSSTGTVFTYTGSDIVPVISSISPTSGQPGDNITITGQYFYSNAVQCRFNSTTVQAIVVSDTQVICTVPMGLSVSMASTAAIPVSVNSDNSAFAQPASFTVQGAPMPIAAVIGISVGVVFFVALIATVAVLVGLKKISIGSMNTPSGWQKNCRINSR